MPAPDLDTELETERTHLIESRAALRRMRGRALRSTIRGWMASDHSGPRPNITTGLRKSR